ncbi:MAG: LPS export ABC transporter permease LptF [Thermodesulfobacteriota bacterium]
MPRAMDIYIFKEVTVPFLLSLAVLTVTALLSKIIKIIELMVTHGIGASFIFWFVVSVIPTFLIYTIPISFLLGVLIAFTRLSSDSEITAMKAGGLSLFNIMKPVLAVAVLAYAVTLAFTLYIFPWGNQNIKQLLFEAARSRLVSGIEDKTFYDRFKGVVLYVDHLNQKTGEMEGIFISEGSGGAGAEPNVFFAKKGVFSQSTDDSTVYLKLFDGTIHRKSSGGGGSYHIAEFSTYVLELDLAGVPAAMAGNRSNRELYPGEMVERVRQIRAKGEDTSPYLIDLHKRFALPASIFVFALLGVPLGIQKIRAARFTGFSVAMAVVLIYYALSTAMEALGETGALNPIVAVWGSDIVFCAAGVYVFYRAAKDAPVDVAAWFRRLLPHAADRGAQ